MCCRNSHQLCQCHFFLQEEVLCLHSCLYDSQLFLHEISTLVSIHPLHTCPHCRKTCRLFPGLQGNHMHECTTSTYFSFPLIFVMFLKAIFNTIISKEVIYHSPNHYWSCQGRSTQTGSSAFRKYCCVRAPVTNWNCGKDKQCSSIMLCKHKMGIISWQCWEKADRNILH